MKKYLCVCVALCCIALCSYASPPTAVTSSKTPALTEMPVVVPLSYVPMVASMSSPALAVTSRQQLSVALQSYSIVPAYLTAVQDMKAAIIGTDNGCSCNKPDIPLLATSKGLHDNTIATSSPPGRSANAAMVQDADSKGYAVSLPKEVLVT